MVLCLAVALLFLIGCSYGRALTPTERFNVTWQEYLSIPGTPASHVAKLSVTIVVTEDINYPAAAATYQHPQGVIRIKGKVVGGKILLCESLLGHEVLHALQQQDGIFVDPDEW